MFKNYTAYSVWNKSKTVQLLIAATLFGSIPHLFGQGDSTKKTLPFAIAKEKQLPEEDLKNKKEGLYVTALPQLSSDPVNGFGYGAEGFLYFDGKKTDPFFNYTPYRCRVSLVLFNTTKAQKEAAVKLDIPYIFNSKWRLRTEFIYDNNPNMLYFGISERSLQNLSNPETNITYSQFDNYDKSMSDLYKNYNRFTSKDNITLNLSGERSFFDSKMRAVIGIEYGNVGVTTFADSSLLQNESAKGLAKGVGHFLVNIIQSALVYDTRDLETDPGKGIFAEITNELSLPSFGSTFSFNKTFAHVKLYKNIISGSPKKLLLAVRAGAGYIAGNAPFHEYQHQWSSEGEIGGAVGGGFTLRGYKQSRFVASAMSFLNVEMRYRITQFKALKQHIILGAVPFFDLATIGDTPARLFTYANNYRYSEGMGLRVVWNVNTVLRFDYALSKEDKQFFFQFGHTF